MGCHSSCRYPCVLAVRCFRSLLLAGADLWTGGRRLTVSYVAEESMLWQARNFGDAELYRQASGLKMPSCDKIQDLSR